MAIQMRRGAKANLDTSKLVAGEIVMATDQNEEYVAIAKGASDVMQLATKNMLDNATAPSVSGETLVFGGNA